jgi:hypothetical protein
MTLHAVERFGIKTKLMANPIMVQLARGIARPSLSVTLGIKLFCGRIQFFENFTMCDLDNFDAILGNTFLNVYKIDILHNEGRLRICAKCGSKLVNLNANHNYALAKMGMNLVALAIELKLFSFLKKCL